MQWYYAVNMMGSSPFGNRGVPSVGSSFGEQTSYSFQEQMHYKYDGQFPSGTEELLLKAVSSGNR